MELYPADPTERKTAGDYFIAGQVLGTSAVRTASDIPLSARGRGAALFTGTMDNTKVFFRAMKSVLVGADNTVPSGKPPPRSTAVARPRMELRPGRFFSNQPTARRSLSHRIGRRSPAGSTRNPINSARPLFPA